MVGKVGNITVEAQDPHALSVFWAGVLGYPPPELPVELERELRAAGLSDEDLDRRRVIESSDGSGQRMFFRRAHGPREGRNSLHLDILAAPGEHADHERIDAEKDRVVALGARAVRVVDRRWGPFPEYYWMLEDPEGNPFCIQ